MAQHDHQFHVKSPIIAFIQFVNQFNNKSTPIFIESISDQFVVFHSHLKLPITHQNEQVPYEFTVEILEKKFTILGVLLRNLTTENATIHKFEAKFDISESERSRLFKLLSRYNISIHKLLREEALHEKPSKVLGKSRFPGKI